MMIKDTKSISDENAISDSSTERLTKVHSSNLLKYANIRIESITNDVLSNAVQWLQQQWNFLEKRKHGSPITIIKSLSDQQKLCDLASQRLKPFIREGKLPSLDQWVTVRNAAERNDNTEDRYIADAVLEAIKQDLIDWKKNFDDYSKKKFGWLCKANQLVQSWFEQGQKEIFKSPDEYNKFTKKYNQVRKEGVVLNAKISEYNDFFPKTPIEKLKLPEKLHRLDTNANSRFSSNTKSDLMKAAQALALGALVINPVSARPIDNALEGSQLDPLRGNGNVFRDLIGNPPITLSQDAPKDAWETAECVPYRHTRHRHTSYTEQPTLITEPTI